MFAFALLLLVACSDSAGSWSVEVDLQRGQVWVAVGGAVDDSVFCANGSRRVVAHLDPDGTRIPVDEVMRRWRATPETEGPDFDTVTEMTCADGSGALTFRSNERDWVWAVVSGRGAYANVTGSGTYTIEFFTPTGETIPGDPPQGAPLRLDMDGELTISE